jgi:hypothetical protein
MSAENSYVLFLGAGASAAFGYPVTSQILGVIRDRLLSETLFTDRHEKELDEKGTAELAWQLTRGKPHVQVFPDDLDSRGAADLMALLRQRLRILLPGIEEVRDQLPLITDVLSLIDHLLTSGDVCSPRFLPKYMEELRELLERAIMAVLEKPIDPDRAAQGQYRLDKLTEWICGSRQETGQPVTVVTTNYDVLLERAIYSNLEQHGVPVARAVDFGFGWRDPGSGTIHEPPADPRIRFYKLHGSLNWLRRQLCGFVYINIVGMIYQQAYRKKLGWGNTCDCLQGPLRSLIVAPSMVRQFRDPNLLTVWQRSLEALRRARQWVIIGYSLPGEDLAIRSILMRAERGHEGAPEVAVYQRDPALEGRFRLLFPNCRYEVGGVERFIDQLTVG